MIWTLAFTDPIACRVEHAGGKGANLAILTQRGFPVPPGFVTVPQAYREWIAAAGDLRERVQRLPFGDAQALRESSEQLRGELRELELPAALAGEIRARLGEFPVRQCFSVRSSSTMEDMGSAAFAGQHESYLNAAGEELVLARVKDCFLSIWLDRALAYRQQQGMDHLSAAMAVVVQQMVQSDVSGVAFSVNPVSGSLDQMLVDANYGLGESVVSGDVDVDHWVLTKPTGKVLEARVAAKTTKVVGVEGGTADVEVEADASRRASLSDAQLGELAALVERVEQSYRFPQDVEWAIAAGRLHLLHRADAA